MKHSIVYILLLAGLLVYADAALARGGGAPGGGPGAGPGGPGPSGPGPGAPSGPSGGAPAGAPSDAGPAAASDSSATTTGPGDGLGGPPAGIAQGLGIYRSPAAAWPARVEYPLASPRTDVSVTQPPAGVAVTPSASAGVIVAPVPATPQICPGVNPTDPRKC